MPQNYPGKPPGWQPKGAPASAIPPTPPVAHGTKSSSSSKAKSVHPQPIGTTRVPHGDVSAMTGRTVTQGPNEPFSKLDPNDPFAPKDTPGRGTSGPGGLPRKSGGKSAIFTLPWVLISILAIVLAYDLLKYWKEGTVPIETAGWNAATYMVRTLEGNSAGNPSATRPGREPNTGG